MTSQPLVSIVTPVYNEEEYLAECIRSVLTQTYQNWDYTVLDNQSTDGTAEVAHRYARKDSRIRVISTDQFLPVIANHNAALRLISPESKYCKVLFGDDWLFPECLARMVAVAEEHRSVGIVGAYCLWGTAARNQVGWTGLPYPSPLVSGRDICRSRLLNGLSVFGSATSVLFRADLVRGRDPFYNEDNLHSDQETCLALLKTSDFGFVHQVLTFTREHPESISMGLKSYNTCLAGDLYELATFGREYLTPEEYCSCLTRHMAKYYRFLGKRLVTMHDASFWKYHKQALSKAGFSFQWTRLALGAAAELASAALNPKDTLARLLRRSGSDQAFHKGIDPASLGG